MFKDNGKDECNYAIVITSDLWFDYWNIHPAPPLIPSRNIKAYHWRWHPKHIIQCPAMHCSRSEQFASLSRMSPCYLPFSLFLFWCKKSDFNIVVLQLPTFTDLVLTPLSKPLLPPSPSLPPFLFCLFPLLLCLNQALFPQKIHKALASVLSGNPSLRPTASPDQSVFLLILWVSLEVLDSSSPGAVWTSKNLQTPF